VSCSLLPKRERRTTILVRDPEPDFARGGLASVRDLAGKAHRETADRRKTLDGVIGALRDMGTAPATALPQ